MESEPCIHWLRPEERQTPGVGEDRFRFSEIARSFFCVAVRVESPGQVRRRAQEQEEAGRYQQTDKYLVPTALQAGTWRVGVQVYLSAGKRFPFRPAADNPQALERAH